MQRCTMPGCGQFFRTIRDVLEHELNGPHCEQCGWGMDPLGFLKRYRLTRAVVCEACDVMAPTIPVKTEKRTTG